MDGTAFLFPGQGAYDGSALAVAYDRHPQVKDVLTEIDKVSEEFFGRALTEILFGAGRPGITQLVAEEPWVSQLAIYGSSVAAHQVLVDNGVRPDVLAGHSLGEIAALVAAGVFSVQDGARVIVHRVQTISELGLPPGRMVALSTDVDRARKIIDVLDDSLVAAAVENHDGQTVLSGPSPSLGRLLGIARLLEIGAVELTTPFPFHTPMLSPAVDAFASRIAGLDQGAPSIPVYSPILQSYYGEGDVASQVAAHFVQPVRFASAVRFLREQNIHRFVEVGGMTALAKLVPKILPSDPVVSTWGTLSEDASGRLALDETVAGLTGAGEAAGLVGSAVAPETSPELFAEFWTVAGPEIAGLIRSKLAEFKGKRVVPAAPPISPPPAAVPSSVPGKSQLAADLRALYAAALEYPEEVLGDDVLLEAELGVDSVKQVELLHRVSTLYGLPQAEGGVRLANYDTMAKIVDFVHGAVNQ